MSKGSEKLSIIYRRNGFNIISGFSKLLGLKKRMNKQVKSVNKIKETKHHPRTKIKHSPKSKDITSIVPTITSPKLNISRKEA